MKRNSSSGKTEETVAQAAQSDHDTYTTKTDRCSRRFGRRFSSGASRRLHAIFFIKKGSDRRLRTSPSRGYCWGFDLRERARRLIPASKTSPNLSTGLRSWATRTHEGCPAPSKTPGSESLTFEPEGEGQPRRNTSPRATTYEASKEMTDCAFG